MTAEQEQRFWSKVDVGDCWQWTAVTNQEGYGRFRLNGRLESAHRVAWQHLVGPIPDGHHMDHLCRNHGCVNPDHLEPVTHSENIRRGSVASRNRNKTHCKRGHPYDDENTRWYRGGRNCQACAAMWRRIYREREAA